MTNLSIPDELVKLAKEAQINMSAVAEKAIKDKLSIKEIKIEDKCEFCGRAEEKASKETNYIGLTWLCPDEKWICESCLDYKRRNVTIAH